MAVFPCGRHFIAIWLVCVLGNIGWAEEADKDTNQLAAAEKKALDILRKAEKWELISLEPCPSSPERIEMFICQTIVPKELRFLTPYPDSAVFHDFPVLGRMTIEKAAKRAELADALEEGMKTHKEISRFDEMTFLLARVVGGLACAEYDLREGRLLRSGGCFNPRHGIRVKHNGKKADFVICFECGPIEFYVDGRVESFSTHEFGHEKFEATLKAAKVPFKPRLPLPK